MMDRPKKLWQLQGYSSAREWRRSTTPAERRLQLRGRLDELRDEGRLRREDRTGQPVPIAQFAPGVRPIRLFRDGTLEYQSRSGSIVGATARVDASGSKRLLRDTREVFLVIEGPDISIAASLASKAHHAQKRAREFAAKVNQLAMQLGAEPSEDLLDQLEQLGRLRDSGVLSDSEFQAQKSSLLRGSAQ